MDTDEGGYTVSGNTFRTSDDVMEYCVQGSTLRMREMGEELVTVLTRE